MRVCRGPVSCIPDFSWIKLGVHEGFLACAVGWLKERQGGWEEGSLMEHMPMHFRAPWCLAMLCNSALCTEGRGRGVGKGESGHDG